MPYFTRPGARRRSRGRPACRSACAPSTSRRSARPPGTARSSRWPATSPSATTSRKARSSYAWELITGSHGRRRLRLRPGADLGRPSTRRRRGARRSGRRSPACRTERIQRRGMEDNYWSTGVPGPGRPVLGDLLRPRPGVRRRGRPGRRRGPLPGDLEPGLHAGRARRGERQGRLPDPRPAAEARTSTPAWASSGSRSCCRASTTSTRSTWSRPVHAPRPRELAGVTLRRATTTTTSGCGSSPTTCAAALMLIGDGVTPGQRGPRLRAAPAAPPRRPLDEAARRRGRRRCPSCCRSSATR